MGELTGGGPISAAQYLLPDDEQYRLDNCVREPIRTPGFIQAHGVLLAADLDTLVVTHASENTATWLGVEAGDLLGRQLEVALGGSATRRLLASVRDLRPRRAEVIVAALAGRIFDTTFHRAGDQLIVELEPAQPVAQEELLTLMIQTIEVVSSAETVESVVHHAARAIRSATRFDKVMVYHFHEDGHGEIVADDHAEDMDDYLGLHFPASDIPLQARRLFVANTARGIVDAHQGGAAVLALAGREDPPLDLGRAELRGVSPHHLAFMANMGQVATLSLSLTRNEALVGMITCAHRTPRHLPYRVRRAMATLTQQVTLQMAAIQENGRLTRQLGAFAKRAALATRMHQLRDPVEALVGPETNLLSLLAADGAAACLAGEFRRIGDIVAAEQSQALARRLRQQRPGEPFVTVALASDDADLARLLPGVAGLVFVPLIGGEDYLVWYRREVLQTVNWLGDQSTSNRATALSPRSSFNAWRQSVADQALPWEVEELAQALELRTDVNDLMLRRAQERLAHQGLHDDLTGLPNRRQAIERLSTALGPPPTKTAVAVLFVDIDRFKLINDSFGHLVGDHLIQAAGIRLRDLTRPGDLVARLGGDEFMLAFFGADPESADQIGQRVVQSFRQPILAGRQTFHVGVSVGLTTAPVGSAVEALDLLRDADTAMYLAKGRGGAQLAVFEPTLRPDAIRRLDLEQALGSCLERDELELHYQPIFTAADQELAGAEALLRWDRGWPDLVLPEEFVPILEATGLIIPVGRWVVGEALRQLARWRSSAVVTDRFTMAVNLSARQFSDPTLVDEIGRLLATHRVPPENLTLEITETAAISNRQEIAGSVRDLGALGARLSIDDFGTGYSSMSMLTSVPVNELKVDRQFVAEITAGRCDDALAAVVVNLAHRFGMTCVAEGVENETQLSRLRSLGCDFVQGFHLGRPLTAAEFIRRCRAGGRHQ